MSEVVDHGRHRLFDAKRRQGWTYERRGRVFVNVYRGKFILRFGLSDIPNPLIFGASVLP